MSYYGYPNPQAYGANYQAYAAAYAAAGTPYDQYQAAAAYNAAAYRAMQQQQQQTTGATQPQAGQTGLQQNSAAVQAKSSLGGVSISQPAQRYDYSVLSGQQPQQQMTAGYEAAAYASNMMGSIQRTVAGPKWPGQPTGAQNNRKLGGMGGNNQFNKRRNPPGQSVQIFYCEVCKISCAGPQTYKEHLDGQKHKKREQASKLSEQQSSTAVGATGSNANAGTTNTTNSNLNVKKRDGRRMGSSGNSRNSIVIRCELCDVACTGRDAYSAHVRGMKHQKTLKLHQKLGKPIPPDALEMLAQTTPATGSSGGGINYPQASVISAPPQINMNRPVHQQPAAVLSTILNKPNDNSNGNTNLTTINTTDATQLSVNPLEAENIPAVGNQNESDEGNDEDNLNIEPIGREYLETRLEGKILSFYCKLCDCQFNDPNAKDMHSKGRRHRLAYKKKVDPSFKVDIKSGSSKNKLGGQRQEREDRRQNRTQMGQNQINNASNSGAQGQSIKPLMSSSLLDSANATEGGSSQTCGGQQTIQQLMSQPIHFNSFNNNSNYNQRQSESSDDKHIMAKHSSIFPGQDEINAIQEIVTSTEKALKLVSDQIAEEDNILDKKSQTETNASVPKAAETKQETVQDETVNHTENKKDETQKEENQMFRMLKGVMRVGLLAKGLLLKGDTDVQLIVLCANKPTKTLLERVYKILLQKIDIVSPQIKYSIILDKDAETILIVKTPTNELHPLITCKVLLTSPAVRTVSEQLADQEAAAAAAAAAATNSTIEATTPSESLPIVEKEKTPIIKSETTISEDNDDLLDKQRCLDSLASLRHAKWFQARAQNVPNCVIIIRILRDLCRRNPTWAPLTQWGLELLVEKSLASSNQPLSPGEALRRVLECVSSGVILPYGPGLSDPCEKDPTDVSDILKNQQREELTSSAQMALRLLAFKQIYKILGMECLTTSSQSNFNRGPKKRPHNSIGNDSSIEEKKEKKDTETNENEAALEGGNELKTI